MNTHHNAASQDVQFDAKTEAVIEKVRKLMALADNNPNEKEAEAAADKARKLLEAYNLDVAIVGRTTNKFAPRQEQKIRGGLYKWQRDLWHGTATLNFCRYWYIRGLKAGAKYEHQLLGSKVNVLSATLMAEYLQDTVERLARNWVQANRPGQSIFIKEAIAFREGAAARISNRLWTLRANQMKEDEKKQREEREANAARGVYTENALVIADVISTEEDLNSDYVFGYAPGTSARNRKERERQQKVAEEEVAKTLAEHDKWEKEHPEEAAKLRAKEEAQRKASSDAYWAKVDKRKPRKMTPEEERRSLDSYTTGYNEGSNVSFDKQVNQQTTRMIK